MATFFYRGGSTNKVLSTKDHDNKKKLNKKGSTKVAIIWHCTKIKISKFVLIRGAKKA